MQFLRRLIWRGNALVIAALAGLASNPQFIQYTAINLHPADKNLFVVLALSGFAVGFVFARAKIFASLDTWLHEFGHAVVAAGMGGRPQRITLAKDMSGATNFTFRRNFRIRNILVSAAGPMASIVALAIATKLAIAGSSRFFLLVVTGIVVAVVITTVRSKFGWFIGILVAGSTGLCVALDSGHIPGYSTTNASLIFLAISVSTAAGVGMREALRRFRFDSPDGDEGKIAKDLHVPERLIDFTLFAAHLVFLGIIALGVMELNVDWATLLKSSGLEGFWNQAVSWVQEVIGQIKPVN